MKLKDLPLGLYEKAMCFSLSWEEKLDMAHRTGFDFVEVNIDGTEQRLSRLYDGKSAPRLRDAIASTGIPVYSMALSANRTYPIGTPDSVMQDKGVEIINRGIDFAAESGIRLIHLAPYDVNDGTGNAQTRENFFINLEKCVEYATSRCVTLALEVLDEPFMSTIQKVMRYVRMIDSPFLQVYADVGNLTSVGADPVIELPAGGRHIAGIHIKDAQPGVLRDVLYGDGVVDFDACFRTLAEMRYRGILVAEMWSHDKEEFHAYLGKAASFIKQAMADY